MKKSCFLFIAMLLSLSAYASGWYINGEFIGWKDWDESSLSGYQFQESSSGIYELDLAQTASPDLTGQFLIVYHNGSDFDWSSKIGKATDSLKNGELYAYATGSDVGNFTLDADNATIKNAKIVLNTTDQTITISGESVANAFDTVYLVGNFGDGWTTSTTAYPLTTNGIKSQDTYWGNFSFTSTVDDGGFVYCAFQCGSKTLQLDTDTEVTSSSLNFDLATGKTGAVKLAPGNYTVSITVDQEANSATALFWPNSEVTIYYTDSQTSDLPKFESMTQVDAFHYVIEDAVISRTKSSEYGWFSFESDTGWCWEPAIDNFVIESTDGSTAYPLGDNTPYYFYVEPGTYDVTLNLIDHTVTLQRPNSFDTVYLVGDFGDGWDDSITKYAMPYAFYETETSNALYANMFVITATSPDTEYCEVAVKCGYNTLYAEADTGASDDLSIIAVGNTGKFKLNPGAYVAVVQVDQEANSAEFAVAPIPLSEFPFIVIPSVADGGTEVNGVQYGEAVDMTQESDYVFVAKDVPIAGSSGRGNFFFENAYGAFYALDGNSYIKSTVGRVGYPMTSRVWADREIHEFTPFSVADGTYDITLDFENMTVTLYSANNFKTVYLVGDFGDGWDDSTTKYSLEQISYDEDSDKSTFSGLWPIFPTTADADCSYVAFECGSYTLQPEADTLPTTDDDYCSVAVDNSGRFKLAPGFYVATIEVDQEAQEAQAAIKTVKPKIYLRTSDAQIEMTETADHVYVANEVQMYYSDSSKAGFVFSLVDDNSEIGIYSAPDDGSEIQSTDGSTAYPVKPIYNASGVSTDYTLFNVSSGAYNISLDLKNFTITAEKLSYTLNLVGDFGDGWDNQVTDYQFTLDNEDENIYYGNFTINTTASDDDTYFHFALQYGLQTYYYASDTELITGTEYSANTGNNGVFKLKPGTYVFMAVVDPVNQTATITVYSNGSVFSEIPVPVINISHKNGSKVPATATISFTCDSDESAEIIFTLDGTDPMGGGKITYNDGVDTYDLSSVGAGPLTIKARTIIKSSDDDGSFILYSPLASCDVVVFDTPTTTSKKIFTYEWSCCENPYFDIYDSTDSSSQPNGFIICGMDTNRVFYALSYDLDDNGGVKSVEANYIYDGSREDPLYGWIEGNCHFIYLPSKYKEHNHAEFYACKGSTDDTVYFWRQLKGQQEEYLYIGENGLTVGPLDDSTKAEFKRVYFFPSSTKTTSYSGIIRPKIRQAYYECLLTDGNDNYIGYDTATGLFKTFTPDSDFSSFSYLYLFEATAEQGTTGVNAVNVDDDIDSYDDTVYYNLQGIRVDNPSTGIYIRRQGNKASKVYIK